MSTENTNDKRTFKWGDQEYLLDDLLKLHALYQDNYYNFARDRGKYDEYALQRLRSVINDRINLIKNGEFFDSDGTHSSDKVDNISIQTQKKGLFKKDKYVDQDNTEWAKYYLNKLVNQLNPYVKKRDTSNDWDKDKFGLNKFFETGLHLNAQEIFENFDLRDPNNKNQTRLLTERRNKLKEYLVKYNDWIKTHNFDFTQNDNEWDDSFMSDLTDFIRDFDNISDRDLPNYLRKFGLNDDFVSAFTSNKWDLKKTQEELDEERKKEENKEKAENFNRDIESKHNIFLNLDQKSVQLPSYLGEKNSNFYRTKDEYFDWARNNIDLTDEIMQGYIDKYNTNPWDAKAASYALPYLWANSESLRKINIKGTEYVYDPNTIDRNNYSFIALNPATGEMSLKFLYDIESEYNNLLNKYIKPGSQEYFVNTDSFKSGGILKMQSGGEALSVEETHKKLQDDYFKNKAKELGISEKEARELERTPLGEKTLINNSEFTGNDIVDLATMGTNIASMFMTPIAGAAVGAGSSVVEFINDWNRDGFQWKDAGNLITNLGMDVLGIIPVIGDTFGTLGKVRKGLVKLAPKIIKWIGIYGMGQGLMNSPEIIDSFSKIVDDRDMTTQDWKNVASGIQLIVSGSRVGAHKLKDANAKAASVVKDSNGNNKIQIEVKDKRSGESKLLVLDGKNAESIKNSNKSIESVNKIIQDIDGFKDYEVVPESKVFGFKLANPFRKKIDPDTGELETGWFRIHRPWEPNKSVKIQGVYDPIKYAREYNKKLLLNSENKNKKYANITASVHSSKNKISGEGKQSLEEVKKTYEESLKTKAKKHKEKVDKVKERLPKFDSKINDINTKLNNLEQKINSEEPIINNRISEIESVKK